MERCGLVRRWRTERCGKPASGGAPHRLLPLLVADTLLVVPHLDIPFHRATHRRELALPRCASRFCPAHVQSKVAVKVPRPIVAAVVLKVHVYGRL
eukprot:2219300-Prymnesium_polylepis.1